MGARLVAVFTLTLVAAAGGIAAQTTDWSATLTSGAWGSGAVNGYHPSEGGSLSDTDFVYDGTTHTIHSLEEFGNFSILLLVYPPIPEPETAPLVLEAEGYGSLRFDEAVQHGSDDDETYSLHTWVPSWDWTDGETIDLRLIGAQSVQPVPAVPVVGLVIMTALLAGAGLGRRLRR